MRWILMPTDDPENEWVEYLGSDDEWELICANKLYPTFTGAEKPKPSHLHEDELAHVC